jgi:RNA polymerase sigma factor (sigma-70 family)
MTTHDSELLKAYAADGSEPAFNELVRRHLGLVHSAALRLLDGNTAEAEDVAQTVFTDLARKAHELASHGSLAGWLHTSTRFAAGKLRRTEQRRRHREQTTMNLPTPDDSSAVWEEIQPFLDDALHELPDPDREAVLLRFFEKLSLTEVGTRLGVGEDAARKRVERAVARLRELLAKRGVTSATAAGLVAAFTAHLTAEASAAFQHQIAGTAMQQAAAGAVAGTVAGGGVLAWFLGWPAKLALVAGVAAIVASVVIQRRGADSTRLAAAPNPSAAIAAAVPSAAVAHESAASSQTPKPPLAEEDTAGQLKLLLYLVDAATDKPVTGGEIEFRGWEGGKFIGKTYHSDTNGYARVYYPIAITDLEVTTRIDGLADTRLKWTPKNGEIIPPDYTLRLVPAVPIGGIVVDETGQPIMGAKVGLGCREDAVNYHGPESHEFSFVSTMTDERGHWVINRISQDVLRKVNLSANHPDFVDGYSYEAMGHPEIVDSLLAHAHRLVLEKGFEVIGKVTDTMGAPFGDVNVAVGLVGVSDRREAKTAADGSFIVRSCRGGTQAVSASAEGFATATIGIEVRASTGPVSLVLARGQTLRLRVVDPKGIPIQRAWVAYSSMDILPDRGGTNSLPQAAFEAYSDSEGRVVWSNAPPARMPFVITADSYMRRDRVQLVPAESEHEVTLNPALHLVGEVRDAETGQLVPEFRMILGWPQWDPGTGRTNAQFSRFESSFSDIVGGRIDKKVTEPTLYAEKNPGYVVKIEATGYGPYLSRPIAPDEGDVMISVILRRAKATTLTLRKPDGSLAADTEIAVVRKESRVQLVPGGFDENQSSEPAHRTDEAGKLAVSVDDNVILLVAAGAAGYGEFSPEMVLAGQPLDLQRWGRIEGALMSKGKPLSEGTVTLQRAGVSPLGQAPLQASYWAFMAKTDEAGRFFIPIAPPGKWSILPVTVTKTSATSSSSSPGNPESITIPAGQTIEVTVGANGTRVVARPLSMDGTRIASSDTVALLGIARTAGSVPPKELIGKPDQLMQWYREANQQSLEVKQSNFQEKNGVFAAEDVQPGDYVLQIMVFSAHRNPDGTLAIDLPGKAYAIAQSNFTVPDPAPPEGIDLGEIRLEAVTP